MSINDKKIKDKEDGFLENTYFGFIQGKYYAMFLAIALIGVILDTTPKGFLGGFFICTIFGLLLEKIGDNLPIIRSYFGGGPFVTIFAGAALVYFNLVPEGTSQKIVDFIKPMDYIGLVVGALICGSILTMDRKILIKAGKLYFIPILSGIFIAFSLTGIIGQIMGYGWREAIMFIALPIMGGGTSAGAVPISEMYGSTLAQDSGYYLSLLMPAVAIGNALAIVFGGFMNKIGNKYPNTTGNGVLIKGVTLKEEKKEKEPINFTHMGTGFIITGLFFTIGITINKFIPSIHYYAWTIITVAVVKIAGIFPRKLETQIAQWYSFLMKISIPAVLFGIGFVYTDLTIVLESLTISYFVLVFTTLLGAVIGAWVAGRLIGFYPVESAITAGLCMANMGGSGDIATLGASKRMELMPFAQISSRIGGALIIIIGSILASVFASVL
jgi:Na+/citrate or Na+/malate symporter